MSLIDNKMEKENQIPHIVHYCWYGGNTMNYILRKCVESFPKIFSLKKGRIIRWDEDNTHFDGNDYVNNLFKEKQWGFFSDYIRLKALYEYGGIYLDTDILVRKELPDFFYNADMIIGYAFDDVVCTAFVMVKPHHPFIKHLLDMFESFQSGKQYVNNGYFTQALIDFYPDFKLDGKFREFAPGCFIYPRWYFDSISYHRDGGYTIHEGMGSWHKGGFLYESVRPLVKLCRFYIKPFGVWYANRVNRKMVVQSPHFDLYKKNVSGK